MLTFVKDFSTRSLDISEGKTKNDTDISTDDEDEGSIYIGEEDTLFETDLDIKQFQMRRKWETRLNFKVTISLLFLYEITCYLAASSLITGLDFFKLIQKKLYKVHKMCTVFYGNNNVSTL